MTKSLTPVRVMITPANVAAWAAVLSIDTLKAGWDAAAEELKARFRREEEELRNAFQERNRQAWNAIESDLGLDPDREYALCTQHMEHHQVVFLSSEDAEGDEEDDGNPLAHLLASAGGGGAAGIGAALARALGGRVAHQTETGGVIEVKL